MRSFLNLQFARVQQAAATTFVALAFMLVLPGSMFSVSAFDVTAPQFANDAAKAVGDNNLYNASVSVLTEAFLA